MSGDGDIQAFHGQDVSEGGQLDCQALAVPAGIFPDLVVGKREGAPLGFRQSPYLDCGDLLEIEQLCRCVAAVAGDHDAIVIDQDRHDKAECRDAVGNFTDLLARMGARVAPVGRELVDRNPANIDHTLSLRGRHSEHERADRRPLQRPSICRVAFTRVLRA